METVIPMDCTSEKKQQVIIPFSFTNIPIKKLALINFKKNEDSKYIALEPQYLDDKMIGKGYRVIAYRKDGYVDVYDEKSLHDDKNDSFDVAGKGLCERLKVEMASTRFEKTGDVVFISFQFTDKYGRNINVFLSEKSTKKSRGINLLAPVGSSTENPSYLPLFYLYHFDFVRKYNTTFLITIDENNIRPANFPFPLPKDGQWRSYTRYSNDCHLFEFANQRSSVLEVHTMNGNQNVVCDGEVEYAFTESGALTNISLRQTNHQLSVVFKRGIPNLLHFSEKGEWKDTFEITADEGMGVISGEYSVKRADNKVTFELVPSGGWTAKPDSLFTKMMFTKKSIFCSWPKTYKYTQVVDVTTLESTSTWLRV
ncbi:hypothetical protein [Evansella tamaricis]|uniref:Uncharacterized protein n=1 Tax=Evansella tamaricis TaxID=2069301 RepID=A0ABS6JE15_9BACI|nr:hypothetical protein [Evansella tamaricis]MBU9711912.1 hypothetical protein [Evansella tamaricis]